jgi:hypothetical protein
MDSIPAGQEQREEDHPCQDEGTKAGIEPEQH